MTLFILSNDTDTAEAKGEDVQRLHLLSFR